METGQSQVISSTGTFRSLSNYNYRLFAGGALVSNIGTWMHRTAQDWIVLTQLTRNSATAIGVVMMLRYGPQIFLVPLSGHIADHFDRRKVLLVTQATLGILALVLGLVTISGLVQLWHVYVFALLQGIVTALDSPARQTFVAELVGEKDLSNAVALNSTSFNAARMIGPAIAGILIAAIGSGWLFLLNAASYAAIFGSLCMLRICELKKTERSSSPSGHFMDGFHYIWKRPDLRTVLLMIFLIGTFGLNFPIFISTMSVSVFHAGAKEFGFLMSAMAIGSVAGALLSAKRAQPRLSLLLSGALIFGIGFTLAAFMPNYWLFGLTLVIIGISSQTFTTTANSTVQLATESAMRGRVMAIYLALSIGGTPIGAPFVGWVADTFGPRWSLGVGAISGFAAAIICLCYLLGRRKQA